MSCCLFLFPPFIIPSIPPFILSLFVFPFSACMAIRPSFCSLPFGEVFPGDRWLIPHSLGREIRIVRRGGRRSACDSGERKNRHEGGGSYSWRSFQRSSDSYGAWRLLVHSTPFPLHLLRLSRLSMPLLSFAFPTPHNPERMNLTSSAPFIGHWHSLPCHRSHRSSPIRDEVRKIKRLLSSTRLRSNP
jgi:hypothetical protein